MHLGYPNPEDSIFYRIISDIFVVLRETTLTISDSTETGTPVEIKNLKSGFPLYNGTTIKPNDCKS